MEARCARCGNAATFGVEMPSEPGKRWSAWCSQACLLEWEIERMVVVREAR